MDKFYPLNFSEKKSVFLTGHNYTIPTSDSSALFLNTIMSRFATFSLPVVWFVLKK
jgi:hypothetical protein